MSKIDILLTTFNGEKYLSAQVDSLLEQSFKDWRLLIRDDGSSDDTVSIIRSLVLACPEKIVLLEDDLGNIGVSQSFSTLLLHSTSPYVAFCDQDDIWLRDKLERQLQSMLETESVSGKNMPVLVHTDLQVVTETLTVVADSFWKYQNIDPVKMSSLNVLLLQNCVTGCTCLLNRSLVQEVLSIPKAAIMHDWWVALVAVLKGKIVAVPFASMRYRQHAHNDTGAKAWGLRFILRKVCAGPALMTKSLRKTRVQAMALSQIPDLNEYQRNVIQSYVKLYEECWLVRRISLIKNKFHMHGLVRNIALFLMV